MSGNPELDELLAPLRDEGADSRDRPVEVNRERVLARMDEAARSLPLERARRIRRFAVLAIAAGFAVVLGAMAMRAATRSANHVDVTAVAGDVTLQGSTARAIAEGQSAQLSPEGDLTTAPRAEAHIHTEAGLDLDVFENTRVALSDLRPPSSALRLGAGAVRCHVPHLAPKQTFSVVTPDATVVVHGTVFSVEVRPDGAATETRVRVDEGVVVVRYTAGEVELTAGQSWTNHAPNVPPPAATEPNEGAAIEKPSKTPPRGPARRGAEGPASNPGTLDQETRLLRSGLAAERSGDLAGAAASFEQLLSRYPQSPLVPDARAALHRVKARHGEQPR